MDTGVYNPVSGPLTGAGAAFARAWRMTGDLLSLIKPRVVLLHLLTASTAMVLAAEGFPQFKVFLLVLLGGALTSGAANAFNCYFDRELDKHMPRTMNRPLPSGRIKPGYALILAAVCLSAGLWTIASVSVAAAGLALSAVIFYVAVYTLWLKRHTPLSAVASLAVGAVPPLAGWIAIKGTLSLEPILLSAIIAMWTPPHFWSLALWRAPEYQNAGLTVTPERTALLMPVFQLFSISAAVTLGLSAALGAPYMIIAAALSAVYLGVCVVWVWRRTAANARRLYLSSIAYLGLIFAAILTAALAR
jgi:heme o synthase